jgi:hypothetical protein
MHDKRAGNRHTLLLAAGELTRKMPRAPREADGSEGFKRAFLAFARADARVHEW